MIKIIDKKQNTAITLIALVITIVVLIILAAVAINLSLGNNGIFNRAKSAKEQYSNAQEYEQEFVAQSGKQIDSYVGGERGNESVELLLKMMKPNTWEVGVEQNFGDNLYGVRLKGKYNRPAGNNGQDRGAVSDVAVWSSPSGEVVGLNSWGGWIQSGGTTNRFAVGTGLENDSAGTADIMLMRSNGDPAHPVGEIVFRKCSNGAAANNLEYDIWVTYVVQ